MRRFPPLPARLLSQRPGSRVSETLLDTTTGNKHPSALLSACEQAAEFLSIGGVVSDGDVRISSPPPRLGDVVRSLLSMVGDDTTTTAGALGAVTAAGGAGAQRGVGRRGGRFDDLARFRVAGGERDGFPTQQVQVRLLPQ